MNNNIFFFFYNLTHKSELFDKLVIFIAEPFGYIILVVAGIFLLVHHDVLPSQNPFKEFVKKWREIVFVFFSASCAWLFAKVLKALIHAPRPFDAFPQVHSLFAETGYGFPSGHATFFSALAVSIFFCHKKVGYIFMFFALVIGFARIIAGVHFPLDIIGGFALGSFIAIFLHDTKTKII